MMGVLIRNVPYSGVFLDTKKEAPFSPHTNELFRLLCFLDYQKKIVLLKCVLLLLSFFHATNGKQIVMRNETLRLGRDPNANKSFRRQV